MEDCEPEQEVGVIRQYRCFEAILIIIHMVRGIEVDSSYWIYGLYMELV